MSSFTFMYVSVISVVVAVIPPGNVEIKVYKCCREDEWLDSTLRECKKLPLNVGDTNKSVERRRLAWLLDVLADPWNVHASGAGSVGGDGDGDGRGSGGGDGEDHLGGGGDGGTSGHEGADADGGRASDRETGRAARNHEGGEARGSALIDVQMPNCSQRQTLRLNADTHNRYQWLHNGSLVLYSPSAKGSNIAVTFTPEEFCVDKTEDSNNTHAILLCPCNKLTCVNKCCALGYIKRCSKLKCTCEKSDNIWTPFHSENELLRGPDVPYEILEANEPACPNGELLWIENPYFKPHHYKRYWWEYPKGYLFSDSDVCGDFAVLDNWPAHHTIGYCYVALLFDDMFYIGSYLRIPPTVLLTITLFVLIFAPEQRLSVKGWVHSKSLMCHTSTLLLSNVVIVAYVVYNDDTSYCCTTR